MRKSIYVIATVFLLTYMPAKGQVKYLDFMDQKMEVFPIEMINCRQVDRAPTIDGVLDDPQWKNLEVHSQFAITDYVEFGKTAIRQTEVMFTHDSRYLYLGFTCFEPDMDEIRAACTRFDNSDILYDDRIEILLDTKHDHKNIIRLAVNSLGVTYDTNLERPVQYSISYVKGDDRWNTEWRAKVKRYDDRWTGEIAIALDRIYDKTPETGATWGINVVRDSRSEFMEGKRGVRIKDGRELSALVPIKSYVLGNVADRWIEPNQYADLVFDQDILTVNELQFHEAYANYNGSIWHKPQFFGDNPLQISATNNAETTIQVKLIVETENYDGRKLTQEEVYAFQPMEKKQINTIIKIRDDERQVFHLRLLNASTGQLLYETSYDTRVPPFVEFDLSSVYALEKQSNAAILVASVATTGILDGTEIRLILKNSKGEELAKDMVDSPEIGEFVPCFQGFDGATLATDNYTIRCELIEGGETIIGVFNHSFTKTIKKPVEELNVEAGTYSFGGEEGKSIVVNFPAGERFVFWEHASYVPWWDLDNMAVTYEFMETWNYGNQGCSEPMQDKENRYSRPEIIENSPARVVVLWRYALADPNYQIMFNEWVYEYYYLYPDGTGVREIRFFPNSEVPHEVLQPQYVFPTGVIPNQMFQDTACVLMNTLGEQITNLLSRPVLSPPPSTGKWKEEIMRIYLKSRKHPYLVWSENEDIFPNPINNGLIVGDVQRSMGGHWPLQPMNVDVYSVVGTNKPYHSWLGSLHVSPKINKQPNRWVHLIGITDRSNKHLVDVAKNWLKPPDMKITGAVFHKFDKIQKGYVVHDFDGKKCTIQTLGPSSIENPVFIFEGRKLNQIKLSINGKEISSKDFKYSPIEYQYGEATLLWLGWEIGSKDKLIITTTN